LLAIFFSIFGIKF